MSIAALIRDMIAEGATPQLILIAVEAIEAREAVAAESKAKAAERKRRQRERDSHGTVTGQSRDNPSPPCPPLDKEIPPTPPKEINPPPIPPQPDTADAVVDCEQSPPVSPDELIEAWNLTAEKHGLPRVSKLSDQRKAKIRTFLRNNTIEEIQQGLAAIERSRWLRGENERGWKADFDFFLQPRSFTKLIEGSYDH